MRNVSTVESVVYCKECASRVHVVPEGIRVWHDDVQEAASLLAEVKRLQDLLASKNGHHKFHSSISRPFVPGMEWSSYGGPRNLNFTANHIF